MAAAKDKTPSIDELLKSVKTQQENLESYQADYDDLTEKERIILEAYKQLLESQKGDAASYHESVNVYSHQVNLEASKVMGDSWLEVYRSFYDAFLNSLLKRKV